MELQERLNRLTPEQRALLASRLSDSKRNEVEHSEPEKKAPVLKFDPDNRYEPFQLTDLQHAYWIGRTAVYEMGNLASRAYIEIKCEDIRPKRFEKAIRKLIERHDMLRVVVQEDGRQQVLPNVPDYHVEVVDLRNLPSDSKETALRETSEAMLDDNRPASEWPLLESRISLTEGNNGRVHFCFDLLNVDAGSIAILLRELAVLYKDADAELPVPQLTFRDYVLAEEELQKSDDYLEAKAYWKQRLADLPAAPDLPLKKDPASVDVPKFTRRTVFLEKEEYTKLKEAASRNRLTMTSVLVGALSQVLHQWCRHPKFTLNLPIFNRAPLHPEVDDVVGAFTSVELLGIDTSMDQSFGELAGAIQSQLLEDLDNRAYDGVHVMRDLIQRGDSGRMPFVFTSLVDIGFDQSADAIGKIVRSINQTAQVWMDVHVDEKDGGLLVKWDSVDELFEDGLPEEVLTAYGSILNQLATSDEAWKIHRFDLRPEWQKELAAHANETTAPFPDKLIHTLFEETAHSQPEKPAIITPERELTYGELDSLSNQIGRRLREVPCEPDSLVAVVMEKGWEQIAAVYGILKSGAAYVPLDASIPEERLHQLLKKAEVKVVLTQSKVDAATNWPEHTVTYSVDESTEWSSFDNTPLEPAQNPENLAYVIYTSGSTGIPKGVMIEHRSVVNRMTEINDRFTVGQDDRVMGISALHHDLSIYDLFGTFWAGAALVLPSAERSRDPAHWLEMMGQNGVTFWNSVPAFLEMLVEYSENTDFDCRNDLQSLRSVILAGDWIPVNLPDRLRNLVPEVRIIASGGPTETTVWDIWYETGEIKPTWKSIPYGQPLRNARYHILNQSMTPCPTGVTGELYIGGEGLARGYWGDEEKTNEKFLTHPRTGERLYRSGDTGRRLPDGNIEFMGRDDFQVKIRGHRIEPGEIEATLRKCPSIKEAVVVAKGETNSDRRLVAYIVQADGIKKITTPATAPIEAYDPELGDILSDPFERISFKTQHLNLRPEKRESISFEDPRPDEQLQKLYQARQSYRQFDAKIISQNDLGAFLATVKGYQPEKLPFPKFRYPSPGNLFPVQLYIHIKPDRVEGIEGGVYYYHPEDHRVEVVSKNAEISKRIHTANNQGMFDSAAFSIFLIGQLKAIEPLYGTLARDFCLIEAGYMSQLMMSAAPDSNLGLCPIGSVDFDQIRPFFRLDDGHFLVHSLVGGRIRNEQKSQYSLIQPEASGATADPSQTDQEVPIETQSRNFLEERLPDYMIPAAIVPLESIPLTANGKINRKALPDVENEIVTESASDYDSELARQICDVYSDLLGTTATLQSKFFDLGGNSLKILQLHRKLAELLAKEITIADLFRLQSPQAIAEFADGPLPMEQSTVKEVEPPPEEVPKNEPDAESFKHEELKPIKEPFFSGIRNRLYQLFALYAPGLSTLRPSLHRKRGVKMGNNIMIGMNVMIETAHPYLVSLGNNVEIGIGTVFIGHFRETTDQARMERRPTIVVKDNVFIGPGVKILPNVTIGEGAVITAGSVVNESVPPHTVVQGVPAKPVSHCELPLVGNRYDDFVASLSPIMEKA